MRIVHYSQHVLGMGHFFRSLRIAEGLCDHRVTMVTGGSPVDAALPGHVTHIKLPTLMMDADFSRLLPGNPDPDMDLEAQVEAIKEQRARGLMQLMDMIKPEIFLVELFPFGRKKFGFELLPVLEAARKERFGPMKSVCSLRDILVEKTDQAKYENRVLDTLNSWFDGVLVHSDPDLVTLDMTFAKTNEILPELAYTGYVASRPEPGAGQRLRAELGLDADEPPMIVASLGGGSVGAEFMAAVLKASAVLALDREHRLFAFSGPFMDQADFDELQALADSLEHVTLSRFTDRFDAYLDAADLSVSLGGYNTTMGLLASGTFGLMAPFDQNREQRMRGRLLQDKGLLELLEPDDLEPERLARTMAEALSRKPAATSIDLDGAANTARLLEKMAGGESWQL